MSSQPKRYSIVAGLLVALGVTTWAVARHPTNPGPANPPIRFPQPPPEPLLPEQEIKTFRVQPGFRVELVACEPMVEDPIAMSFDVRGRIWVVEMRGYMHDMEGTGEDQPTGKIKILESTRGDGTYNKVTTFLDHLVMPRAVLPVRGGALVGEPPNLWYYRESAEGKAGQKTLIASDFGTRGGQPEYLANSPTVGLDNWIYCTNYPHRLRFQGGKWVLGPMEAHGQWGLTQDDYGRLYFNYNEDLLRANFLPAFYFLRNPNWSGSAATNVQVMHDQTVWPSHPTPGVNRGYQPGILRDDGTLRACTANCGPMVYRGDLFPKNFYGNVFICEPAGNLIKRVILGESRGIISAQNAYYGSEFLASTDERFRPVNLTVGPEGALYVVDFARGVLEHERFITNYLARNIKDRHLELPIHRGRIFRIVPEGSKPKPFKMPQDNDALVKCLSHPNGWVRDMAHRLLVERHDFDAIPSIQKLAASRPDPLVRLRALWTLEGMNQIDMPAAVAALSDTDGHVRAAGVRFCEPYLIPATRSQILPELFKLVGDPDVNVHLQLLLTLSAVADSQAESAVISLLEPSDRVDSALARDCALSGLWGREMDFLQLLMKDSRWERQSPQRSNVISALSRCVLAQHRAGDVARLVQLAAGQSESLRWRQKAILAGVNLRPSGPVRRLPKLIYLDSEPVGLPALLTSEDRTVNQLASDVDGHLAWPGKPGVPPAPKVDPLSSAQQAMFDHGKQVFTMVCAACHQPTGLGQGGLAPPLVDSEWLLGPPVRPIRIVLNGLSGPIKVDGVEFNLEMPAVGTLSDEDIAAVLTYARREWDHTASPVDTRSVSQVRAQTRTRPGSWTAEELLQVR